MTGRFNSLKLGANELHRGILRSLEGSAYTRTVGLMMMAPAAAFAASATSCLCRKLMIGLQTKSRLLKNSSNQLKKALGSHEASGSGDLFDDEGSLAGLGRINWKETGSR